MQSATAALNSSELNLSQQVSSSGTQFKIKHYNKKQRMIKKRDRQIQ
jgi:hypothetical protein